MKHVAAHLVPKLLNFSPKEPLDEHRFGTVKRQQQLSGFAQKPKLKNPRQVNLTFGFCL